MRNGPLLRLILSAGLIAAGIAPATAAAPAAPAATETAAASRLEAARTLIDLLDMERALDNMFNNLKGLFADNVIASMERGPSGESGTAFFASLPGGRDRFAQVLGEEFVVAMRAQYPDFKQEMAGHYAAQFSIEELQSLSAFFRSGAGAKWRALSPQLEKSMGEWGNKAGMKAGAAAFTAALERTRKPEGKKP